MRRFVSLLPILLFLTASPLASLAAETHVVATVGDIPITTFEVERRATRIMPFNVSYHGTVTDEKKQEIRDLALEDMILRGYKICYAKRVQLQIPQSKIDEKIEQIKVRLETPEVYQAAVAEETEAGLRASIERGFLATEAENLAVNSKVAISDEEVRKYYQENKHTFLKPKQFRASQIVIRVDPAATEEVRAERYEKAKALMEQAKAGEDFYNLAYYNSEDRTSYVGGDMGMFHKGRVAKPIENALLEMEIDEISDVVETIVGYHVLKLTQVIEPTQLTFEEMQPKIRARLEKNMRDGLYEEWIEELKASCEVKKSAS